MRLFTLLLAAFVSLPAFAVTPAASQQDLYAGLMDWAVRLSKYPAARTMPTVRYVPQQFFDDNACAGHHCRVWGWYPNTGKNVVYVNEKARDLLNDGSDPRSLLAASIVVHEFVHYLQAASRGFAPYDCDKALQLEREAYQAQNAYLGSYGRFTPVGTSMLAANCAGSASHARIR
jgi:hypothetical protein